MNNHLWWLRSCFLWLCLLGVGVVVQESSHAITAAQIAAALDNPAGVTFGVGNNTWTADSKSTFKAGDVSNIPTVGRGYLYVNSPAAATTQGRNTFTIRLRGAGTLIFNYQVSLDYWNASELIVYEGNDLSDWLWSDGNWWEKGDYTADDWWIENEIYVDVMRYTRDLTFAVLGPEAGDDDDEGKENLLDRAWLDSFVWVPDTDVVMLEIEPNPEEFPTFISETPVFFFPGYDNLTVRYTTDGSTPTAQSQLYDEYYGFQITETTTVKAVLFENGQPIDDTVYTATYTKKTASPDLELSAGAFTAPARVAFTCETAGAEFYYTLGGAQPLVNEDGTAGAGTFQGAAYTLNGDTTISVMAVAPGAVNSDVVTRTFSKVATPTLTCLLDGHAYSEPPVFDQQATVTLAGPAGATIAYKLDDGAEQVYAAPLVLTASATITAQARQAGKISSDVVSVEVTKASTQVTLPALAGGGWQVFAVPGEISQSNSDAIIAARQPLAYDAQRRVYAKASRIRGGHAYWVFGEKPALSGISMTPIEAIGGTMGKWFFTAAPSTEEFNVPNYFLAHRWDSDLKRYIRTEVIGPFDGSWLYNMSAGPK